MKIVDYIKKTFDHWARTKIVRVALFGQGLSLCEWESLSTSIHSGISPRVRLVKDPSQADVLAIHGPITSMNINYLNDWINKSKTSTHIIAIGPEVDVNSEGMIYTSELELTNIKISRSVFGYPPKPEVLQGIVKELVNHV